ncbi:mechanosensitive ion channel domain-containing protein [Thiolapillus sp.]
MSKTTWLIVMMLALSCLPIAAPAGEGVGAIGAGERIDAAMLRAELEKVQSRKDLLPERQKAIASVYEEAQDWLAQADQYKSATKQFLASRTSAPLKAKAIHEALGGKTEKLPKESQFKGKSLEELEQLLETEKAKQAALEARVAEMAQAVAMEANRPDAARKELTESGQQMDELQKALSAQELPADAMTLAQYRRNQAKLLALKRQIAMLEQEMLSHPARLALSKAQLEQAETEAALAGKRVALLEDLVNKRRKTEVERVSKVEEKKEQDIAEKYPALKDIAMENARLGKELKDTTQALERASKRDNELREQAQRMEMEYRNTQRKVEIAGLKEALGQILLEHRKSLPDPREYRKQETRLRKHVTETGLRQIQYKEQRRQLNDLEAAAASLLGGLPKQERARLKGPLKELLQRKRELLDKLVATDEAYLRALSEQDVMLRRVQEVLRTYDEFLAEHLLWVRNTAVLGLEDLKKIPAELRALFNLPAWLEVWRNFARQLSDSYLFYLLLLPVLGAFWLRRRIRNALIVSSNTIGKPAGGNFSATLKALLYSFLLPVAPALLLLLLAWQLKQDADGSPYADALAEAFYWAWRPLYSLLLLRALACRRGVLEAHFRWRRESIQRLRKAVGFLLLSFIPVSMLMVILTNVGEDGLAGVLLKFTFLLAAVSQSIFIYMVFHWKKGVVASYLQQHPGGLAWKSRWLWFPLMVSIPMLLVVLSMLGYVYTAATLLNQVINTLWLVAGLVVLQQLAEHWLLLSRRRIAYQAALERRKVMAEKEAEEHLPEAEAGTELSEPKVDLVTLSKESRKLLNAAILITAVIGLWLIWAESLPALGFLDTIPLWQHSAVVNGVETQVPVTLGNLLLVVAIIIATLVASRNLPSLLEIILLQYFHLSSGSRYTIRTLTGYTIAATGMVLVFKAVGGSWDQIQWLVAALGVGIGFGLQEIVANFISGLIILFERPIRVGDYVTVGDSSGTVTRIRIRATTILTRDRKELLVPNKEFITGRLLNWSLSDQTTRLKLAVGIPYGADVELAEKLMVEAAEEHQLVLDEPKPFVYFQSFGDSALLLELRCVIDSVDYRVSTLSELHHAINRKFREAGMEIPYPQQDVHLDLRGPLEVKLQPGSGLS